MRSAAKSKIQKTIRLPLPLVHEAEHLIRACGGGESLNEFILKSMRLRIDLLKRRDLDAKFAAMAGDTDYQKEANLLAGEFEISDWETAKLLED